MADACDLQWTHSLYISQKTFATATLLATQSAFLAMICFCLLNRNMLKDIESLHFSSVQGCIESLSCDIVTDFFFYWLFFHIASTLYVIINVWFFDHMCECVSVHAWTPTHMWRSERISDILLFHSLPYSPEMRFLTEHGLSNSTEWASQKVPEIFYC